MSKFIVLQKNTAKPELAKAKPAQASSASGKSFGALLQSKLVAATTPPNQANAQTAALKAMLPSLLTATAKSVELPQEPELDRESDD